jgi:hypothetical protein
VWLSTPEVSLQEVKSSWDAVGRIEKLLDDQVISALGAWFLSCTSLLNDNDSLYIPSQVAHKSDACVRLPPLCHAGIFTVFSS